MITLVILTEGVDYDDHPAMMMMDATASCGRIVTFVCKGKLAYSQSNVEVKVSSCDREKLDIIKGLNDPVAEHRPFTNQQLDMIKYHLNCVGISCRLV